ncbi:MULTISPECIES: cellulose binding domain-containing protein [Halomonadaceae]|uniref:cellulose binding domain-containing protein n=1 Tax=Halomonadaceae TaxID=28256 RepID=UPI00159B4CE0|nr:MULTISPECIES: cellulose binding domain-containing protein [Halomonas]QJQ95775.1 alginate biosynthesis protein [Halomonas sp. PA5]
MSVIKAGNSTTASELQELIDMAPKGATIELSEGNHILDESLVISRSDISLVGAGSDETTLTFSQQALDADDHYGLLVDGTLDDETIGRLNASLDVGDKTMSLDSAHDLEAGDTVRIWQDNDEAFFSLIGDTSWRKQQHAELRTSMAKVESVNGSTITLDRGVHFDFDGGKTQLQRLDSANNVSLQGFSIGFELGTPDDALFRNTEGGLTGYQAVTLDGTVDAQLSDITVEHGPSTAFHFSRTLDAEVEGLRANGAFNKGAGGNGYAYELRESYDSTFTGLEDSGMRHGLVFASWRSSVDNDVKVAFTDRDINFHGGRDQGNQVRVEQSLRDPQADGLSTTVWTNEEGEGFGAPTDADANEVRFDYVIGSRRDDEIVGTDDGVYLNGGLGHDILIGGDGNDILQSGPGDDWHDGRDLLIGGMGTDTALYAQDYDQYSVSFQGDKVRIKDQKGSDDTLEEMQYAAFADGTLLHIASRSLLLDDPMTKPSPEEVLDSDGLLPRIIDDSTALVATGNTMVSWNGGYVAEIFIENVTNELIEDIEIDFDLPVDIDNVWNGEMSEKEGAYRVDGDRSLDPGEAWRFAFRAYGDDDALPDAIKAAQGVEVQVLGMDAPRYDDAIA